MLKRIERMISIFMKVTTGTLIVTTVYISIFFGRDVELGVEILWQMLSVSAVTSLSSLAMPCKGEKEISKRLMLVSEFLYFVFITFTVLLMGWYYEWYHLNNWKQVTAMLAAILFVYVMSGVAMYIANLRTAKKMNQKLKERE